MSREMRAGLLDQGEQPETDDQQPSLAPLHAQPSPSPSPPPTPPPPATYKRAVNLLMVITFMDAVEYGVVMPSLWAYLLDVLAAAAGESVEPELQLGNGTAPTPEPGDHGHAHYTSGLAHSYYGIIIASFSFTSMLVKPFLGAWCDRRSFKEVFLVTLIVAIGGNLIYAMARFFKRWELLLAGRLLSGAGCANSALSYAYVSRTVEPDSRSGSLAKISLAFPLGMVMGPAFNAITGALNITIGGFMINAGNSPGLLIAALMVVELFLLISFLPEPPPYERAAPPSAAADTADGVETGCGASSTSEHTSKMRSFLLELVSLQSAACFLTVFTFNFAIGASEALVTPITRAAFHWTPLQNSYIFLGISLIMIVFNLIVMRLSRSPLAPLRNIRDKIRKSPQGAHHADVLTKLEGFVGTDAWDNESAVALKAVRDDPLVKAVDVDTLSKVLANPPRHKAPLCSDRTFVIGACIAYFGGVAYVLLVWRYEMSVPLFLLGEVLLLWYIPFVFAPNRAVYSRLTEGSTNQGLHQSLLSIMASAGGIVGPIWLGVSVGVPKVDEHGKTIGPVAQLTFLGSAALVAATLVLYLAASARPAPTLAQHHASS